MRIPFPFVRSTKSLDLAASSFPWGGIDLGRFQDARTVCDFHAVPRPPKYALLLYFSIYRSKLLMTATDLVPHQRPFTRTSFSPEKDYDETSRRLEEFPTFHPSAISRTCMYPRTAGVNVVTTGNSVATELRASSCNAGGGSGSAVS